MPPTSPPARPQPHRIGPYLVIEKIGAGGTARIYRAHDPSQNREVAIKVQAMHLQGYPGVRQRFEREARTLMQFKHPHILPVFDYGLDGGTPYIVMQLLGGRTLNDILNGVPLPLRDVGRLTRQIASALDYAHARGIIHRDIKPHNILFDDADKPYLADFGVAYVSGTQDSERLTTAGQFVGTAAYASPEQCRGEDLDRPSDIYSLAVMVFEMATGRLPFESRSSIALMKMHMSEPPPNPLQFNPNLPVDLYAVLVRALAKLPENRYPSAMRFSEELDIALGQHAIPQASDEDSWLYDEITPVDTDMPVTGPLSPHTVPDADPVFAADLERSAPADNSGDEPGDDFDDLFTNPALDFDDAGPVPPVMVGGVAATSSMGTAASTTADEHATVAGDPLDGIDLEAEFRLDENDGLESVPGGGPFSADIDPGFRSDANYGSTDDPFAGIDATSTPPEPDADAFQHAPQARTARPAVQSVHTLRGLRAQRQRRARQMRVALHTSIALSLVILSAAGLLLGLELLGNSRAEPDTVLTSPELGVQLKYPAGWALRSGIMPAITNQPHFAQLIADRPVPADGPYTDAALVIVVQRLSPVQVFGVPPFCQARIADGPAATFDCQRDSNLPAPTYQRLTGTRYPAVQLPGSLPPTRATMPIILVGESDSSWLALGILHWNNYNDARDLLAHIAETVQPLP